MRKTLFRALIIFLVFFVGFVIADLFFQGRNQKQSIFYWNGKSYKEKNGKNIYSNNQNVFENILEGIGINENKKFIIENNIIYIYQNDKIIWQSDPEWKVENVILEDIDNDKKTDIIISLWKFGKHGDDLPFWLKENTKEWGNHLFIYGWKNGKIKSIWCSSTIDAPIREMMVGDVNGDGKNELIVLEGNYAQPQNSLAEYITVWAWNGWGFSNDYRSKKEKFYNLILMDADKNNILDICVNKNEQK